MGGRLGRQSLAGGAEGEAAGGRSRGASLVLLLPGIGAGAGPAPYARRAGWVRQIQESLRLQQPDRAVRLLRALRKDLGLEGTFLNEVLYKNAALLNLVDPISHDLLMSLARDLQCPQKEYDPWKSSDRICRQLIYHLTPHSKWNPHGVARRKSQASLKSSLQKKQSQDALDLSGISLSVRDVHRLAYYLQGNRDKLHTLDLSFTDLTDDLLRLLLPFLWGLPSLTHLSLNGNRLTRASMKELTDTVKDPVKFPSLAWIDMGNNVDISSMPQPLLVGLRKRLSQQTTLPTIHEARNCDSEFSSGSETCEDEDDSQAGGFPPAVLQQVTGQHGQICRTGRRGATPSFLSSPQTVDPPQG